MTKYSHTRLDCFRKCPLKYRFQYVDKIPSPFRANDSTFTGSAVHATMEKIYKDRCAGKEDSLDDALDFLNSKWDAEYDYDGILHPRPDLQPEWYRGNAVDMVTRYYNNVFVRDDMKILGLETDDTLELPDGNGYYIRIDKLGWKDGTYYVCDYKTDRRRKTQEAADADDQLAMYALWVLRNRPDAKDIRLVWQLLQFDGEDATAVSVRTPEQLDKLERDTVDLIAEIESTEDFEPRKGRLCEYCDYRGMCPAMAPPRVITVEDGAKLVDEHVGNDAKIKELRGRNEQIEADLARLSEENGMAAVAGTEKEARVTRTKKVTWPRRFDAVEDLLREKGEYGKYVSFQKKALTDDVRDGTADPEVAALARVTDSYSVRFAKRSGKGGDETD